MTQIIAKEIFLIPKNKPPERWFFNARAGRAIEILKGVFGIAWRVAWRLFGTGLRPVQPHAVANRLGTNRNELRFRTVEFDFPYFFIYK